jgi:hypothetical protein
VTGADSDPLLETEVPGIFEALTSRPEADLPVNVASRLAFLLSADGIGAGDWIVVHWNGTTNPVPLK